MLRFCFMTAFIIAGSQLSWAQQGSATGASGQQQDASRTPTSAGSGRQSDFGSEDTGGQSAIQQPERNDSRLSNDSASDNRTGSPNSNSIPDSNLGTTRDVNPNASRNADSTSNQSRSQPWDLNGNRWRFTRHNGEWWYWNPDSRWLYWRDGQWQGYSPDQYSMRNGDSLNSNGPSYDSNGAFGRQSSRQWTGGANPYDYDPYYGTSRNYDNRMYGYGINNAPNGVNGGYDNYYPRNGYGDNGAYGTPYSDGNREGQIGAGIGRSRSDTLGGTSGDTTRQGSGGTRGSRR